MLPATIVEEIRREISQNHLESALGKMKVLFENTPRLDEVLHHNGRYQRIKEQIRTGIVDFIEAEITQNQLSRAMLDLLSEVETKAKTDLEIRERLLSATIRDSTNTVGGDISTQGGNVIIGDGHTFQQAGNIIKIKHIKRADFS